MKGKIGGHIRAFSVLERIFAVLIILLIAALGYAYWQLYKISGEVAQLQGSTIDLASTTSEHTAHIASLTQKADGLSSSLATTAETIAATQNRVGGFEQTVGSITGTVQTLEKLSKTDPELLMKYSKVFFLNEYYAPERFAEIPKEYLYIENRSEKINALVWPYLQRLLDDAKVATTSLFVKSAYRSFNEQSALKNGYTVMYGAGTANQFSADQGYSEHQLGTTVDFITTGLGGSFAGFDKTAAFKWLGDNAYKYGFVLSYPANNPFYIYEPWHWRYVGVRLATDLHNQGKHFYDLDQRDIDAYLATIFD